MTEELKNIFGEIKKTRDEGSDLNLKIARLSKSGEGGTAQEIQEAGEKVKSLRSHYSFLLKRARALDLIATNVFVVELDDNSEKKRQASVHQHEIYSKIWNTTEVKRGEDSKGF